jgi:uncharacterized protein YndB with AHSA1/START domain
MSAPETVRIQHSFAAKPEVVFKAWTTPALMRRWLDGGAEHPADVNVTSATSDLRVGGRFEVVMQGHLLHHGEYRKIVPYSLLVFTWNSHVAQDSLVTVELKARGDHTDLTLTHERLAPDMVQAHHEGWTRALGNLKHLLLKGE